MMSTWCSKHAEAWNKLIIKQKFCASSWLITKINILRCTVSKTSKSVRSCLNIFLFYTARYIFLPFPSSFLDLSISEETSFQTLRFLFFTQRYILHLNPQITRSKLQCVILWFILNTKFCISICPNICLYIPARILMYVCWGNRKW